MDCCFRVFIMPAGFSHFIYDTVFYLQIITSLLTNTGKATTGTPSCMGPSAPIYHSLAADTFDISQDPDPLVSVRVRRAGTEHTAFPTLLLFTGVFTKLLPRNGIRFPLPQILQEKPVCLISCLIIDFSCQKLIPLTVTTAYDKNHTT